MEWETMWNNFVAALPNIGIAIGKFLLVIIIGIIVEKISIYLLRKVLYKTKMDIAVISFVISLSKIVLKIAIVILALGALELDVTALTASLGMFGVALSVALKDTLSSIANGLNIIVNKPFKNGDFVEIGAYSGTIQGIKIMSTELITGDNKVIVIPNNMVNTSAIVNYSTQDTRRVDLAMEVAYGSDVETVKNAMYEVIASNELVMKDKDINVFLDSYGASSIVFKCRFWVKNSDYWTAYWKVQEDMGLNFNKYGIDIPFNQLDVHINNIAEPSTDTLPTPPVRPIPQPKPVVKEEPAVPPIKKIDQFINDKFSIKVKKEEEKRNKKANKAK